MAQKPYGFERWPAEQQALWNYQNAGDEFSQGGAPVYQQGKDLSYQSMDPRQLTQLGPSAMGNISTDPRYANAEADALASLEDRAKHGLTLQDEADQAKLSNDVNRQNAGRLGAIQQNMHARGMSGSGMDLLAQMQSAQDATDREALSSLETAAQSQNNKLNASVAAGNMASQQRGQAFGEDAQKAAARDQINRFNAQNSVQAQFQNNQGINQANQANWQRGNQTADNNTQGGYQFRRDNMGVGQGNAQMQYNAAADAWNRKKLQQQADQKKKSAMMTGVGTLAGGVLGTYFGPEATPIGAEAGATLGGAAGSVFGNMAFGGMVGGHPHHARIDSPAFDTVPKMLSQGEIVIPRSISDDPVKSSEFVAHENGQDMDAVGHLLAAMQLMNKRR